ncbi:MAG: YeeE/YedE family protein [Nevskiaceae bacterium]|nr:MAG: YeeE/YedE family protein [Nevskiaceae bacterium]
MNLWMSFFGGTLIGLAALSMYALNGRIAGISGILGGAFWERGMERRWRLAFLLSLIAGGWIARGGAMPSPWHGASSGTALLIASGLLVGFGTRIGNGCTSGHGVCGLARQSPRSLASVLVFMAIGMATATLLRPLLTGGH